jgi:cyclohexanone monooxygenase
MSSSSHASAGPTFDVVIVGAGFGGMYMLYRAQKLGLKTRVYERGSDVGGTWYWNRYPGARCDVESLQYSYSFSEELQQDWNWSQRYSPQPEILAYAKHVADRFELRKDIQFDTGVTSAKFDDASNFWTVGLEDGAAVTASFVVLATGCLSNARTPDFKGLASFKGETYHTGNWPHQEVDFSGKKVGIVGTGSSGIQAIPMIAEQAAKLVVFQRTPNFSIPAHNAPFSDEGLKSAKANYPELRRWAREKSRNGVVYEPPTKGAMDDSAQDRLQTFERRWSMGGTTFMLSYNDLVLKPDSNATAADFVRGKIAEIVKDPETARLLQPTSHPIGTKRICVDTNYYATFNRPNVELVDVRAQPIDEVTPKGIRIGEREFELDAIVFATGFDAMTGSINKIDIRNGDKVLKDNWAAGPRTYLGLMTSGFPNLFIVAGPGSPSVLAQMIMAVEQHVGWIADCLAHMRDRGTPRIEATPEAEAKWVEHVNTLASGTLYPQANSWYLGANVPGKPRVFMPYIGGINVYGKVIDEVAAKGYEGFILTRVPQTAV